MADFSQLFKEGSVVILDGGFGTTLENTFHLDLSSPLWSAKAIDENPEIVIKAHLAFLRAGARVILTSTYQAAFSTFERAGYTRADAERIMLKSVKLADDARRQFLAERREFSQEDIRIALSIGPFGSSIYPAQEYDAFYPPPYGPKAFSKSEENCNAFGDSDVAAAVQSINELAQFHLERLLIFARHSTTWANIDCIAFETVPLAREVRAIRKTVGLLQSTTSAAAKPWWISLVFPFGEFPETEKPGGRHLSMAEVVHAFVGSADPVPSAIGLNCTQPSFFPALLAALCEAMGGGGKKSGLWLVVYPNGGDIYDPVNRTWQAKDKGNDWAQELCDMTRRVSGTWRGVLVGGCCKTGPDDIQKLSELLLSSKSRL